jgi:hypothetical protein
MLQQPSLFVGIFDFEKLIEFLARNFKGRWHKRYLSKDGFVVRPDEEDKADVIENDEEKCFDCALDIIDTKFHNISVPTPANNTLSDVILIACRSE